MDMYSVLYLKWITNNDLLYSTENSAQCSVEVWREGEFGGESVQFSHSVMSDSFRPHGLQHTRPPCPSPTPRVYSNSCPLSRGCYPTISSSVVPFSSCLQSFPASESTNESALRIRWPKYWSFSFNISPSNEYSGLISLGLTGWISLKSKGLSRVFPNTTVQKNQFFGVQISLYANSHIHT